MNIPERSRTNEKFQNRKEAGPAKQRLQDVTLHVLMYMAVHSSTPFPKAAVISGSLKGSCVV
jgi:hypothetical protein